MTKLLSEGYSMEVDSVDKNTWYSILNNFRDTNLYQTWSYGTILWGSDNTSHLILKKDGEIIACAQVRIAKVPFLKSGLAYIRGGPLWHRSDRDSDVETLQQTLRALKIEYVYKRHLLLRIAPKTLSIEDDGVASVLQSERYRQHPDGVYSRTLLVDLTYSTDELRQGMQRQWRNNLKKAEKNNLLIIQGNTDDIFDIFKGIYHEMHSRKRFVEYVDIDKYQLIQKDLPGPFKMHVMICQSNGNPCAALVSSLLGDTAINLLAATTSYDLENHLNGSHLLFWKMMELAKMQGCRWNDLGGINPSRNPGGYQFKKGIADKNRLDLQSVTQFETYANVSSALIVQCGDFLRSNYRKTKEHLLDGR